jgi:hypothetical protein
VYTGRSGGLGGSLIVNRTVTVNHRTYGSVHELPPELRQQLPIEPSNLESRIRDIPVNLAILVVIGLVLWFFLGR